MQAIKDEFERKRLQRERMRNSRNLQIYIKQKTQLLQDVGSSSLRAFLLKGLTDFFNNESDCMKLILGRKLFDIESIKGKKVIMQDGSEHIVEIMSIVTSQTVVMNKNVDLVVSAISSVKHVASMNGKYVRVASIYFTNEEEILQIMKQQQVKIDIELHDAVKFMYETMLHNIDVFKHVIDPRDVKHVDTIERYLKLKGDD